MPPFSLDALWGHHFHMLSGSYFSGIDHRAGDWPYVWSDSVADIIFNYALARGGHGLETAVAAARRRDRLPAVLLADANALTQAQQCGMIAEAWPERWMALPLAPARPAAPPRPENGMVVAGGTVPPPSLLDALVAAQPDQRVAEHVERHYATALRGARPVAGVSTFHLGIRDGGRALAYATLHLHGGLAGLYNVATATTHQGRGLGAALSRHAVDLAAAHGCAAVFLQCAADSAAERLYRRVGFAPVHTAYLATLV